MSDHALNWILKNALNTKLKSLDYPVKVMRENGVASIAETPKLIVGTIHSVKGGEADVVYLWPDVSPAGAEEWAGRQRDSVRRMFYVAMTRAKEELIICEPKSDSHVNLR